MWDMSLFVGSDDLTCEFNMALLVGSYDSTCGTCPTFLELLRSLLVSEADLFPAVARLSNPQYRKVKPVLTNRKTRTER